jgi:hypothetical protein
VDDLPVVIHWLSQMRIERLINQELPAPHGNRQGLSYGQLAILFELFGLPSANRKTARGRNHICPPATKRL